MLFMPSMEIGFPPGGGTFQVILGDSAVGFTKGRRHLSGVLYLSIYRHPARASIHPRGMGTGDPTPGN